MATHIGKPLLEDVPPVSHSHLFLDISPGLSILLEHYALFLFALSNRSRVRRGRPPGECAFKPVLPMVVYRRGQDDHDGELREEDTVEDEGLGFVPCFEALRNDVAAGIYGERGQTRRGNRRELHGGERTWARRLGDGVRCIDKTAPRSQAARCQMLVCSAAQGKHDSRPTTTLKASSGQFD